MIRFILSIYVGFYWFIYGLFFQVFPREPVGHPLRFHAKASTLSHELMDATKNSIHNPQQTTSKVKIYEKGAWVFLLPKKQGVAGWMI